MGKSKQKLHNEPGSKFHMIKSGSLKCMFIFCFLLPALKAVAPGSEVAVIFVSTPVNAFDRFINAIVIVESLGNTMAYNKTEEAYGAFQIRPIRLLDYYQRTGKHYKTEDCYNFEISKEIFLYYAIKKGYLDYQSIARNWNGSGKRTLAYWEKVKKHM